MENAVAKFYADIELRLKDTQKQLEDLKSMSVKTLSEIDRAFKSSRPAIDTSLAKKNVSEVEQEISKLKSTLAQKISIGADLGALTALKDRINQAEAAIRQFQKATEDPAFIKESQVMAQLRSELLQVGQASELSTEATADFIQYNNLSLNAVNQLIAGLKQEQSTLAIGSQSFKDHGSAITNLQGAMTSLSQRQQQLPGQARTVNSAVAQMNMTMGQLGFAIGDADMFMYNFRMGMMSVANNIPMVVQGLGQVKDKAAATGQTFSSVLAQSIMGSGGVMLGINALMFALNVLPGLLGKTTKAVEDQASMMKQLGDEYSKLTSKQLMVKKVEILYEYDTLKSKDEAYKKALNEQKVYSDAGGVGKRAVKNDIAETPLSKDEKIKYEALKRQIDLIDKIISKTGLIDDLEKDIANNILKRKQITESNYAEVVKGAKNAGDAIEKMTALIREQQETLSEVTGGTYKKNLQEIEKSVKERAQLEEQLYNGLDEYSEIRLQHEVEKLQLEVSAYQKAGFDKIVIAEYVAKQMLEIEKKYRSHNSKLSDGDTNSKGLEQVPGGNDVMLPIESDAVSKQKEQADAGFKSAMDSIDNSAIVGSVYELSDALSTVAVKGEDISDVFKNIALDLVQMVAKALLFKTIMSAINGEDSSGKGESGNSGGSFLEGAFSFIGKAVMSLFGAHEGGMFVGIPGGVKKFAAGGSIMVPGGFDNDSYPLMVQSRELVKVYTPAQQSQNMQDYNQLLSIMDSVNNSIRAMNGNLIRKAFSADVRVNLDVKELTHAVMKTERQLTRSGDRYD